MSYYPDHPSQECAGTCVTEDCGNNEGKNLILEIAQVC